MARVFEDIANDIGNWYSPDYGYKGIVIYGLTTSNRLKKFIANKVGDKFSVDVITSKFVDPSKINERYIVDLDSFYRITDDRCVFNIPPSISNISISHQKVS